MGLIVNLFILNTNYKFLQLRRFVTLIFIVLQWLIAYQVTIISGIVDY